MKQPQRFFQLLDNAGQRPSRVNAMVESVRDRLTAVIDTLGDAMQRTKDPSTRDVIRLQRAELDEIRTAVLAGGKENSALGDIDLKALETWGLGNDGVPPGAPQQQSGLRPGERIADVGEAEGQYTGDVDEASLTDENRRYISRHLGDFSAHWGQVFNAKVRFSSIQGDLANGPESPILPDGRNLADIVAQR